MNEEDRYARPVVDTAWRGGRRNTRAGSRLREHLRYSYLPVPFAGLVAGLLLAALTGTLDTMLSEDPGLRRDPTFLAFAAPARDVISVIGPEMLTFVGVVFSLTLVALQMAAGQLSPRVVRLYVRSRVVKYALGVFLGTFFYALIVQYFALHREDANGRTETFVPLVSGFTAVLLVTCSVVMFVLYVHHTIRLMRLAEVIDRITAETLRTVRDLAAERDCGPAPPLVAPVQTIRYAGRSGALRSIHLSALVRQAARHDCVVELLPRVGDFLAPGTPLARVHGPAPLRTRPVLRALDVGAERSMYQDVGFGLRQLVDIAIRAVSPAVNDPTTCVQALDRIHVVLTACADLPLGRRVHGDHRDRPRVVEPLPTWRGLVTLGFEEILLCAPNLPQVTRRMAAAIEDLAAQAPEHRRSDVRRYRRLLEDATRTAFDDAEQRAFARTPDRQGLG